MELLYTNTGAAGGRLTVVRVDEMRCLRGVVDELDLADLPHLGALLTELLQHADTHTCVKRGLFLRTVEAGWRYTQLNMSLIKILS